MDEKLLEEVYDPGKPLRAVLIFPSTYRAAAASLGFQIVFRLLNSHPMMSCERAVLPNIDFGKNRADGPLRTIETGTPVNRFRLVAFSCSFELDYLRLLRVLETSGIPPASRDRKAADPVVIAGGIALTMNPEPVADALDSVFLGEAEAGIDDFIEWFTVLVSRGMSKDKFLEEVAQCDGWYVPSTGAGTLSRTMFFREDRVRKRPRRSFKESLDEITASSCFISRHGGLGLTGLYETGRGCPVGCAFCVVGNMVAPIRYRTREDDLRSFASTIFASGAKLGLVGSDIGGWPLLDRTLSYSASAGGTVGLSSFRSTGFSPERFSLLAKAGVKTLTIAPETISEKMRFLLGKRITDQEYIETAVGARRAGLRSLKLYFLLGLPGSGGLPESTGGGFLEELGSAFVGSRRSGRTIRAVFSPFIPKPRTPLQWAGMRARRDLEAEFKAITADSTFRRRGGAGRIAEMGGIRTAPRQAALARGGRGLFPALCALARGEDSWRTVLKIAAETLDSSAVLPLSAPLPWETTQAGQAPAKLRERFEKIAG